MIYPRVVFAILAAWVAGIAVAAPPVDAFFDNSGIGNVTLSPQGHHVAFVHLAPDGRQVLGVRETRETGKYTISAKVDSANSYIAAVHWINEERLGFTIKDRRVQFSSTSDEYAADRDGKNLTHLISGAAFTGHSGSNINSRLLTGHYTYFRSLNDGSDDIIVQKHIWNRVDKTPESSRLYRLNSRSRTLTDLLPGTQPRNVHRWLVDTEGVPRLAVSVFQGRCTISYREKGAAEWSELNNSNCLSSDRISPAFFDPRGNLYVTSARNGYRALYAYDIAGRQRTAEPLVSVEGFDFDGGVEIDIGTGNLAGLHVLTDARGTVWFDPEMKAIQQKVDAALPHLSNRIHCGLRCHGAPALLVASMSDKEPMQYFLYSPDSGKLFALGSARPDIRPSDMGQRDLHYFTARDGLRIPAYVTVPPGKVGSPRATVVLVHGGPYERGTSWEWQAEAQFLASRGYLVIQPEFRGTTGYGHSHFQAGWKQWGKAMQDDLADAAQWVVKQGWADPKRIAIMGANYGGYATLMGLARNADIFRCGIEFGGITDISLMFSTVESSTSEEERGYGMKTLIGDPDADAAALQEASPLVQASLITRPVLMAHGAKDRWAPVAHASAMKSALAKHNNAVEYVVYDDEGHGLYHRENRIDFYKRVEAFLAQHLRQ